MQLIRFSPPSPLGDCVAHFWWSKRDEADIGTEYMLPSGGVQLVFALHDSPILCLPNSASSETLAWSRAVVHGPQGGFFRSGAKPAGTVVGVSFRPGLAGPILGVPVDELADRHVPLDGLWGFRGQELRERLLATRGPAEAFDLLERELTLRLLRGAPLHPAVAHVLSRPDAWRSSRITDIERAVGVSPRRFIALFRDAVGLAPKHYFRVRRFAEVCRRLAGDDVRGLADLAAWGGYADQAHMTREFRAFAGITPTQYRPAESDRVLHHRT
jgi:AraC-like DNA-binding protein